MHRFDRVSLASMRALYGAVLLVVPAPIVRVASGRPPDRTANRLARILGLRQLAEAAVLAARPRGTLRVAGVAVDGIHALTAVVWAAVDRPRRRLGLANGVMALMFVAAGWLSERETR